MNRRRNYPNNLTATPILTAGIISSNINAWKIEYVNSKVMTNNLLMKSLILELSILSKSS
jgi:hypothetical protein